jgi:glycosyltransferase involved in cell wall biosynthesis
LTSTATCETYQSAIEWHEAWQRRRGRPLRVLHIGNIANNAYNNARLQRRYGIAADVLCHNYYHIMACPEWEDADYAGKIEDDFFPDWWAVDLKGFRRPRWFAQGPLGPCIRYLASNASGEPKAHVLWRLLERERWLLCRRGRIARSIRWGIRAARKGKRIIDPSPLPLANERISATCECSLAELLAHPAPGIPDVEWKQQIEGYFRAFWDPALPALFSRYDVIQAYATYTIMPFLAGLRQYVAYEHGTIRSIPFADTVEGRCCNATYHAARSVLVTNSDNLRAAEKLGLQSSKIVCLPHAFDSDKLERYANEHPTDRAGQTGPIVFFSPSRQDWVAGDPGWSKGNDRVFHAAAQLKRRGIDFRLRLVEWGRDLQASRELIAALGLDATVQWLPIMKKRELWHEYMQADCVIDQFLVPAIGGVTFEAMMLARRVITAIDRDATQRFFGEYPPLHASEGVEDIVDAMFSIVNDRFDANGRGAQNQTWMRRYHSAERIVRLQCDTYRRIVDEPGIAAETRFRCAS